MRAWDGYTIRLKASEMPAAATLKAMTGGLYLPFFANVAGGPFKRRSCA